MKTYTSLKNILKSLCWIGYILVSCNSHSCDLFELPPCTLSPSDCSKDNEALIKKRIVLTEAILSLIEEGIQQSKKAQSFPKLRLFCPESMPEFDSETYLIIPSDESEGASSRSYSDLHPTTWTDYLAESEKHYSDLAQPAEICSKVINLLHVIETYFPNRLTTYSSIASQLIKITEELNKIKTNQLWAIEEALTEIRYSQNLLSAYAQKIQEKIPIVTMSITQTSTPDANERRNGFNVTTLHFRHEEKLRELESNEYDQAWKEKIARLASLYDNCQQNLCKLKLLESKFSQLKNPDESLHALPTCLRSLGWQASGTHDASHTSLAAVNESDQTFLFSNESILQLLKELKLSATDEPDQLSLSHTAPQHQLPQKPTTALLEAPSASQAPTRIPYLQNHKKLNAFTILFEREEVIKLCKKFYEQQQQKWLAKMRVSTLKLGAKASRNSIESSYNKQSAHMSAAVIPSISTVAKSMSEHTSIVQKTSMGQAFSLACISLALKECTNTCHDKSTADTLVLQAYPA